MEDAKEQDAHRTGGAMGAGRSTRVDSHAPDTFDPSKPRLGRRESEPHSEEITTLFDVLSTNFPGARVTWDLHHYFSKDGLDIDLQFDVSFFQDMVLPEALTSYKAVDHGGRVPDVAFNILSKSTWRADIGEHVDECKVIGIRAYVVFASHHVATGIYKPPFLRAYLTKKNGDQEIRELRAVTMTEGNDGFNEQNVLELDGIVPFRLGIMKRERKHEGGFPLYRLLVIDPSEPKPLLTKLGAEKEKTDKEKARADKERERADKEKERADKEKERADRLAAEIATLRGS